MNYKEILFSLLTLLSACSDSKDTRKIRFSVPFDTVSSAKVIDPNNPPLPPQVRRYYTNFNFIVDSSGRLYFYQQQTYRWKCGTGMDENTPPGYIDLRPKEIVVLSQDNLRQFLELNVFNGDVEDRVVAIGLLKDTVTSEGLYNLLHQLSDTTNKAKWFLRAATQEEQIVIDYKNRQASFFPEDIKWDSSKTIFPPRIERMEFVPPKIEY